MITELANGDSSCEQLTMYSKACVQRAYEYFQTKFDVDLASTIKSFKAARFFLPKKIGELELTAAELDLFSSLSFLGVNEVASLKSVLHIYPAAVESISSSINPPKCWHNNTDKLPNWVGAFTLFHRIIISRVTNYRRKKNIIIMGKKHIGYKEKQNELNF